MKQQAAFIAKAGQKKQLGARFRAQVTVEYLLLFTGIILAILLAVNHKEFRANLIKFFNTAGDNIGEVGNDTTTM